jgi:Pyruvate/2-oxoacid:ferredoxin oxidoreductase gamma subunit
MYICGVGGQSVPVIVSMLSREADKASVRVSARQSLGAAQRSGTVRAEVHFEWGSEAAHAPSSFLVGLELLEGMRGLSLLRPGDKAYVSQAVLMPPGAYGLGAKRYPTVGELTQEAERRDVDLVVVDAAVTAPWKVVEAALCGGSLPVGGV